MSFSQNIHRAVAVGSLLTALFDADDTLTETINDDADAADDVQEIFREEDCDITGDIVAENNDKILHQREETKLQPKKELSNYTMDELRRCYEGKPQMPLQFSRNRRDNMCIVFTESDESAISEEGEAEYSNNNVPIEDDVMSALEDVCSAGDCEKIVPSIEQPESNKRVNVLWHDQRIIADGSHYPTNTVKPQGRDLRKRSRSRRGTGIKRSNSQQDNDYTDAENEGALLLSQSFRVAASVFGAAADAVRFTGEAAAVCTGGTARLAGGVIKLSSIAVNSLGSAIENGSVKKESAPNSGKPRTSKRKVAGESVRLLGESIEQVADSLLLAGSATESKYNRCPN